MLTVFHSQIAKLLSLLRETSYKSWQNHGRIGSKLHIPSLFHWTHGSCHDLGPLTIHLSPSCFHMPPVIFEDSTSENPCLQEKISLNPTQMPNSHHLKGAVCLTSLLTSVKTSALLCLHSLPPASPSCQKTRLLWEQKRNHPSANHSLSFC